MNEGVISDRADVSVFVWSCVMMRFTSNCYTILLFLHVQSKLFFSVKKHRTDVLVPCPRRFYTISGSLRDTPPAKEAQTEMWDRHLRLWPSYLFYFGQFALFPALCALHLPSHTLPVTCYDIIKRSPLLPGGPGVSLLVFAPTLDLCVLPAAPHLLFLGNTSFPGFL